MSSATGAKSKLPAESPPPLESLEARQLLSTSHAAKIPATATVTRVGPVIYVRGTTAADSVSGIYSFNSTTKTATETFIINGVTKTIDATLARRIRIDTFDGNDTVSLSGLSGSGIVAYVHGGAGDDTLSSSSSALLDGGDGNDKITGSSSINILIGGAGDDTIVSTYKRDIINHGPGNDHVTYYSGSSLLGDISVNLIDNALAIVGSPGDDTISFATTSITNSSTGDVSAGVLITANGYSSTIPLASFDHVTVDGKAGTDKTIAPILVFGTRKFSQKNIEIKAQS